MGDFVGRLTYGTRVLDGVVPDTADRQGRVISLRMPRAAPPIDVDDAFEDAVEGLIPLLRRHRGGLVTIGVDDHTRPNAHTRLLLPRLLRFLRSEGLRRPQIRILIAGGTHRPPRSEEYPGILGHRVWRDETDRVEPHDCVDGVRRIGMLDDGMPVEFNATAAKAAVHIPLTDLDYHYFAGVAGGPKQLMPGLAGQDVITAEHLRMFGELGFASNVDAGVIDGNPVYEYKRKVLAVIREHFAALGHEIYGLTAVMNPEGQLVHLAGGDLETTHREAIPILDAVYTGTIPTAADVVLQGARSLGINLYQSGKAFNTARRAVRLGGRILVAAPAPDRWGNDEFERLMRLTTPILEDARERISTGSGQERAAIDAMLRQVQNEVVADFRIGKQKPIDLLVTLGHVGLGRLYMVSDGLTPEDARALPIQILGSREDDPQDRVRSWTSRIEEEEAPTYLVNDDPGLRVQVKGP